MKWFKFALGAVATAGAVFAFGWIRGNSMDETHQVKVSAKFKCSSKTLWGLVNDLAGQPSWKGEMASATLVSKDPEIWEEEYNGATIRLKTTKRVEGKTLVRVLDDPDLPYQGSWTYEIKELGPEEAQLTVTETATIKNPLYRYIAQGFFGVKDSLKEVISEMQLKLGPAEFITE